MISELVTLYWKVYKNMTVKELIDRLQKFDQCLDVVVSDIQNTSPYGVDIDEYNQVRILVDFSNY